MGFYNIGALMIRIGFWGKFIRRNHPNSIGNYSDPDSSQQSTYRPLNRKAQGPQP